MNTLKLNEFKALYKTWKTTIPFLNHLLLGVLVWLEEQLINNRIKTELDEAIAEWEDTLPPPPSPIYTESPSDTSTSLPEMRLRAPWYVDTESGERSESLT